MNVLVRPIPGFAGYFAATDGTIWSSHRGRWGNHYAAMHQLRSHPDNRGGYQNVKFWIGGHLRKQRVHVVVALAFLGPKPKGLVVCHRDGNSQNNAATNLLYATVAENVRQSVEQGTFVRGERVHTAKVSASQVQEIRRRLAAGEIQTKLAREFGLSTSAMWSLAHGRSWRHLTAVPTAASS